MGKIINNISKQLYRQLVRLGYKALTADDQRVFDPYYDAMNGYWSSSVSFPDLWAWSDASPVFYKPIGDLLCCLQYDGTLGKWGALPFIGRYSVESVGSALRVLRCDMETLQLPLYVAFLSEWMLLWYQSVRGVLWEIERPREWMDYVFQRTDFEQSLNKPDNMYRYRYFLRRFSTETVPLTSASMEECLECMRTVWCSGKECTDCYACPLEAVEKTVSELDKLRAGGILVRVDGKPAGFCIVSCRNGSGIYLFKHANNHIKGLNEYLLRECYLRFMQSAKEINYTNDMGNEGLKAYKSKLAPYSLSAQIMLKAMELKRATPEEVRLVYERDLVEAFPPMELRTWPEIEDLMQRNKYEFLCLHDGAEIVGTVSLCPSRPGWTYWEYLCVTPTRRNAGLGKLLVQAVLERYSDSVIFGEVEAPAHAPDPALAARRRELYLRNGFFQAGFEVELFGVCYNVLYHADAPLPDADIQREYDALCQSVYPPDEYERYIRIPYKAQEIVFEETDSLVVIAVD